MALNFEPDWVTIISSSRTSTRSEDIRYRLSNPAPSKLNNSLAGSALGTIRARQKLVFVLLRGARAPAPCGRGSFIIRETRPLGSRVS